MPGPLAARPFDHALERAYRDGLRGEDAYVRAFELVTLEFGSESSRNLLAELRAVLEGNKHGFEIPEIHLALARHEVESLAPLGHRDRLRQITLRQRLRGPAIGEALLERARAALPGDPESSGSWAECAARAMAYSDTDDPEQARHIASCTARAFAFWGNSRRILCDLQGAKKLLDQADWAIECHGVGDLATRAEVASFRGSLLRALRHFDAAIQALEEAEAGWDLVGNEKQQARTCLKMAHTYGQASLPEHALSALKKGASLLSTLDEPHLAWSYGHNEAWFLAEVGKLKEARTAAVSARQLAAAFPDSFTQLRVQWLEGRLRRSEGHPREAIEHFQAVQAGFLTDKNPYDAALVSLDLATLYLELGRHAEVVELATAMRVAFEALGVHREALAAWRLFTDACERQAASVQLAKNLARYLDQARHDPEFGFAASGVFG